MRCLIEACEQPDFPARVCAVLSNKIDAAGLEFAKDSGIPIEVLSHKDYDGRDAYDAALHEVLCRYPVDLICLAGFMRILGPVFVGRWDGRLINIHPSLLPEYKGLNTHERALADGAKQAGCTVHYVSEGVDEGPHIRQEKVPVLAGDTAETLSGRVLEAEHKLYPQAVKQIAQSILEKT